MNPSGFKVILWCSIFCFSTAGLRAGSELEVNPVHVGSGAVMTTEDGTLRLTSSSGRADASPAMAGGELELVGGFVPKDAETSIFEDGFEAGDLLAWSSAVGAVSRRKDPAASEQDRQKTAPEPVQERKGSL